MESLCGILTVCILRELPRWLSGKESACQCRRHKFGPWGRKDPLEKNMVTHFSILVRTSLVAQTVKRLPTMRETWVQSLGQEDLLEKEMATHSSILAWKIPWMEEPGRLQFMGSQRVGHD